MNRNGVYYFWQVADWTPADIKVMDDRLDTLKGRIRRDSWVAQAKTLAKASTSAQKPHSAAQNSESSQRADYRYHDTVVRKKGAHLAKSIRRNCHRCWNCRAGDILGDQVAGFEQKRRDQVIGGNPAQGWSVPQDD